MAPWFNPGIRYLKQTILHWKGDGSTEVAESPSAWGVSTPNLLTASDKGLMSVLVLLDLSAASDTSDHHILLHRMERYFIYAPSQEYNQQSINFHCYHT